jgi:hypothetical protein
LIPALTTTVNWWIDDRGKNAEYWEINLSHVHIVNHKSHKDWLGLEFGSPLWQAGI